MTECAADLRPYELRDPADLLADLLREGALAVGTLTLVLVDDASGVQRVVARTPLSVPDDDRDDEPGNAVERGLERLGLQRRPTSPRATSAWPTVVPVVTRTGRCVVRQSDLAAARALRYVNGFEMFWTGPLVLTPYGWCDALESYGGSSPRLQV